MLASPAETLFCPYCNYDLHESGSRCPECGQTSDLDALAASRLPAVRDRGWRGAVRTALWVLFTPWRFASEARRLPIPVIFAHRFERRLLLPGAPLIGLGVAIGCHRMAPPGGMLAMVLQALGALGPSYHRGYFLPVAAAVDWPLIPGLAYVFIAWFSCRSAPAGLVVCRYPDPSHLARYGCASVIPAVLAATLCAATVSDIGRTDPASLLMQAVLAWAFLSASAVTAAVARGLGASWPRTLLAGLLALTSALATFITTFGLFIWLPGYLRLLIEAGNQ